VHKIEHNEHELMDCKYLKVLLDPEVSKKINELTNLHHQIVISMLNPDHELGQELLLHNFLFKIKYLSLIILKLHLI